MSETDERLPRLERALDSAFALACGALAALAIAWEVMLAFPPVIHERVAGVTRISDLGCTGCIAFLAAYSLLLEWKFRDHRGHRSMWRRVGWSCQAILLAIAVIDQVYEHHYLVLPAIFSAAATGAGGWATCMRTQTLPEEDQKVIDELVAESDRRRVEAFRAAEHRRRQARFQRAAARFQPAGAKSLTIPAPQATAEPHVWLIPEGKHRPLVYFIRNGDRVKIGYTTNLRGRVSALSLRPDDICLLVHGSRPVEQALHKRFAEQRVGNTEWFHNTGGVAEYIVIETARARATAKAKG